MYEPFLTSIAWKGPEPMTGGWELYVAALSPGILLQMCSGTMGIHRRSMVAFGFLRWNSTVASSTATAFLMFTVLLVNAASSLSMM